MSRRLPAIFLGTLLGWLTAGYVSPLTGYAQEPTSREAAAPTELQHARLTEEAATADEHHQYAPNPAASLVPQESDRAYFPIVLMTIVGLFVAAIAVGLLSRAMGFRDPGVVAGEQDHAEAHHGHDDHHSHASARDAHGTH